MSFLRPYDRESGSRRLAMAPKSRPASIRIGLLLFLCTALLTACGWSGDENGQSLRPVTYRVAGSTTALSSGSSLTLLNNGADPLSITADGRFRFAGPIRFDGRYAVTIGSQPNHRLRPFDFAVHDRTRRITAGHGRTQRRHRPQSDHREDGPDRSLRLTTNFGADTVSQYRISSDGGLISLGQVSLTPGSSPEAISIDPSGRFAYVTNENADSISQFRIGSDGTLSPLAQPTQTAGTYPAFIAVDPNGRYVYVTNIGDNTISQYRIGCDGALIPQTQPGIGAGVAPFGITTAH